MNGDAHPIDKPVIPDHEPLKIVGTGSYGEVWLARTVTGQYRAVKVVRRIRFQDNAPLELEFGGVRAYERVARANPYLVDLLHVGRCDDGSSFYYVMIAADDIRTGREIDPAIYVPDTLQARLEQGISFDSRQILETGITLTRGLRHMHESGLVHRDIKPSNILFYQGKPLLADIGLVRDTFGVAGLAGTDGYMAPEGTALTVNDLYSLGLVLYVVATGHPPEDFPRLPDHLRAMSNVDRRLFLGLNEIILKACARNLCDRYPSAAAMQNDLQEVLDGSGPVKNVLQRRVRTASRALANRARAISSLFAAQFKPRPRYAPFPEDGIVGYRQEGEEIVFIYRPEHHPVVDASRGGSLSRIEDLPRVDSAQVIGSFIGWRRSLAWTMERMDDGHFELRRPVSDFTTQTEPHRFKFLIHGDVWIGASNLAVNKALSPASDTFDMVLYLKGVHQFPFEKELELVETEENEPVPLPAGYRVQGSQVIFEYDPSLYRYYRRDINNRPTLSLVKNTRIRSVHLVADWTKWQARAVRMALETDGVYRAALPLDTPGMTDGQPFAFLINQVFWAYLPDRPGPMDVVHGKACHRLDFSAADGPLP